MSLISIQYILLLLVTLIGYYIAPKKIRIGILLIASYVFYWLSSNKLIIFLLISTLSVYLAGLLLDKQNSRLDVELSNKEDKKILKNKVKHSKRIIVLITVLINFGILVVLKYINLLGGSLNSILGLFSDIKIPTFNFILPLGISYYTLQVISYVVDVYRNKYKATKNIVKVALFTSFFPLITEGPICKYDELSKTLCEPNEFKLANIMEGFTFILVGIFKKLVIADRAALYVNTVFGSDATGIIVFVAGLLYTIQIYAEFSGCMDIVMGSSRLFGVSIPQNFRQPFFSKSIQEFWQRWHITLGAWIKEYIFYPISLSKFTNKVCTFARNHMKPYFAKFIAVSFPLLFVWLFNGIWHGASIKYIVYGMYYYSLMMIAILLTPLFNILINKLKINKEAKWFKGMQILRTCLIVIVGMMLFRSHDLSTFGSMLVNIFKVNNYGILTLGLRIVDFIIILVAIILMFIIGLVKEKGISVYEWFSKLNMVSKVCIYAISIMLIIIFGIYGAGYNASDFIYGQF